MSIPLKFNPDLPLSLSEVHLAFEYGPGMFGPEPEMRRLDAIRPSLRDPECAGPDPVYGIAMDIGRECDRPLLKERMLLFGAVVYAAGSLGSEPVRSQGHVHAIASHSNWSPPEVYEIWSGKAIVYAQQYDQDNPGRCVAITAGPGEHVVVPPGWAHCVINANPQTQMAFGAWCDRQYGFVYTGVRAHGGLAWFPILTEHGEIEWCPNPRYAPSKLEQHAARAYPELGFNDSRSLYGQFIKNPDSAMCVSDPQRSAECWRTFVP